MVIVSSPAMIETAKLFDMLAYGSYMPLLAAAVGCYALLCASLRFRRINKMQSRLGYTDRASLSQMSNKDSREIVEQITQYEFPFFYDMSLRFGIFRTFAIDNIGSLVYDVGDLAKPDQAAKRYDDSQLLYVCWTKFPIGSKLLAESIARTNYLHAPYIKAGKIRNEDMLYVLHQSLAAPIRFMRLFEWRSMTDMEVAALGTYWRYIGDMMEVDYKAELKKDQWTDGIDFINDLDEWSYHYENKHMVPSPKLAELGDGLIIFLLSAYPKFMRSTIRKCFMVLLGDRMRHSFSYPEPGVMECAFVYSFLFVRKLYLRYLALPRWTPYEYMSDPDPKTGRMYHYAWLKEPWYARVTFWVRWGPEALFRRARGLMNPGDGFEDMKPQGFVIGDLGPRRKMGKGLDETARLAEIANSKASLNKCPFSSLAKS